MNLPCRRRGAAGGGGAESEEGRREGGRQRGGKQRGAPFSSPLVFFFFFYYVYFRPLLVVREKKPTAAPHRLSPAPLPPSLPPARPAPARSTRGGGTEPLGRPLAARPPRSRSPRGAGGEREGDEAATRTARARTRGAPPCRSCSRPRCISRPPLAGALKTAKQLNFYCTGRSAPRRLGPYNLPHAGKASPLRCIFFLIVVGGSDLRSPGVLAPFFPPSSPAVLFIFLSPIS